MVGIMNSKSRVRLAGLANSAKSAVDLPSKLDRLRRLRHELPENRGVLTSDLLPLLFDLLSDSFGAARKFVTQMLGEIALKHPEFLPEIVPVLVNALKDTTSAVARQAIACGTDLFVSTLKRVAIQGLHSSELDSYLEPSWAWMLKFKDEIYSLALEPGGGGVRLLAMKFVETVILLYTPDPNGSSEPSSQEGSSAEFNISVLRGGHPVLNIGELSIEASQKLAFLLDQLRHPTLKSLSGSAIIVLINSLSSIAKKRPAYYGRILPVLLSLDPPSFAKGVHLAATCRALKGVFVSCLNCSHPAAAPWRDRLADALRQIEVGGSAEKTPDELCDTNGNVVDKNNSHAIKEEKSLVSVSDAAQRDLVRKRSGSENSNDLAGDDVTSKRSKPTPSILEESAKELNENVTMSQPQIDAPSTRPISNRGGSNSGPVQQLVAMFGALVAQGEKAIGSLEILISSISADLLADVVMANMHNIPPSCPLAEGNDELVLNMSIIGDTQVKYPASFLAGVLSLSTMFPPIASMLDSSLPATEEAVEELQAGNALDLTIQTVLTTDLPASSDIVLSEREASDMVFTSDMHEVGSMENEIPGLVSSAQTAGVAETLVTPSLAATDVEDANQDQITSFGGKPVVDVVPSMSTDRSEEFSPKVAAMGNNSLVSSTATSAAVTSHFVLPKISAPLVELADEQKDTLQRLAFMRIVEAYKQITVSGGSQLRFSLFAHLGVEFPLELDPWKLLQEHILSDYLNHEGHELTVRVLYRLYGEAEEEPDFFSSTTAASVYETFLMTVAEALRDSFPPSDKSLSRLLGDAPYLPKSVLKLLESLCCPGNSEKAEKDAQSGDRVTQGLSAVWSLILLRPGIRDVSLKIALQSAVNHLEEVRMKAIRLVANKLYHLSSIAQQIEEFARDMLFSVISDDATVRAGAQGSANESQKEIDQEKSPNELQSSDTTQSCTSSLSIPEAQRCMSLYFALCTKKHSLFRQIFNVYKSASEIVKQAIHRHIPILVRTMGSSSELLEIISDPPSGSENLLMQVLQTLTDGPAPSSELISTIRKLFDVKVKDVEILFPILPFLPRDEVMHIFPHLVNLPLEKFQVALSRVLQGSTPSSPVLSPAEVLIAIHGIQPERDGIPLKKVTDACNACFEQRQIFTQQVLAGVLNQLVEQIPLPLLFMRTVLQAIGAFPALVDFIMDILGRLVSKQIWKYPKLWVGFLKCAQLTQSQSFKVLLQLPPPQLENALNRVSALRAPLVAHASQPDVQSSLPRSTLVVLGLAPDSQTQTNQTLASEAQTRQAQTSEAQTCQAQASDVQTSQAQASQAQASQTETSPMESSQAQISQTQVSDSQASSRAEACEAQTSQIPAVSDSQPTSQAQASPSQTAGSANSENEMVAGKSKESSACS